MGRGEGKTEAEAIGIAILAVTRFWRRGLTSMEPWFRSYEKEEKKMNNYPPDWPDIARQIKEQANWCCEHCHHPHDPDTGHCLTVHHLDLDKSNCNYSNLVALCQRCHLRIQAQYQPAQLVFQFAITDWMRKRNLGAL